MTNEPTSQKRSKTPVPLQHVGGGAFLTPPGIADFLVRFLNPRPDDRVLDPACGNADLLVETARVTLERHGKGAYPHLYGCDIAECSVEVSRSNLNRHRFTDARVAQRDSLLEVAHYEGRYTLVVCNPPWGARLREQRPEVLASFALGSRERRGGSRVPLASQEIGLLFVEMCVRSLEQGGRAGLILPNGYVGNRGERYVAFRRWLLCHARVVTVIGLPRFTFKMSGADVSASVIVLQRREGALKTVAQLDEWPIHFNLSDKVGWDLRSKRAGRVFQRDQKDGVQIRDSAGNPLSDTDFDRVRLELLSSGIVRAFPWVASEPAQSQAGDGWVVSSAAVLRRDDHSLDPKRWCRKHHLVQTAVRAVPHLEIGMILQPITRPFRRESRVVYRYVEIDKIYEALGTYLPEDRIGWALPQRAQLMAAPRDVFIANIWASAGKWMIAGNEATDGRLIVTSGCAQFAVIPGKEKWLADLVFGISSEAFRAQLRAVAAGSDGLASVSTADLLSIVVPRPDAKTRAAIEQRIRTARSQLPLPRVVSERLKSAGSSAYIAPRSSHAIQV